jgi:hypothetical protein
MRLKFQVRPNLGAVSWWVGIRKFLAFMRDDRRWRRHWIISGRDVMCVGVIECYSLEDNDNRA